MCLGTGRGGDGSASPPILSSLHFPMLFLFVVCLFGAAAGGSSTSLSTPPPDLSIVPGQPLTAACDSGLWCLRTRTKVTGTNTHTETDSDFNKTSLLLAPGHTTQS